MKILDEVRYDLFRRIVAARCSTDWYEISSNGYPDGEDFYYVIRSVDAAVEELKCNGIVGEDSND